jgi:hypothetical protein
MRRTRCSARSRSSSARCRGWRVPCTSTSASCSSSCRTTCSTRKTIRRSRPATIPPTTSSSGTRDQPAERARCSSRTGHRCTKSTRAYRTSRFYEQAQAFKTLLATAAPEAEQQTDLDFLLNVGHLFSLIVYGQLILEQAALTGLDDDIVETRSSTSRFVTSARMPLRCTASRPQRWRSRSGRWARSANRCPMPSASAGYEARHGIRRRLRDASLTPHTRDRRAW